MTQKVNDKITTPFPPIIIVKPRSGDLKTSMIWDVMCAIALRIILRLYTDSRAFPLYLVSTEIVGKKPKRRFPDNFCLYNGFSEYDSC